MKKIKFLRILIIIIITIIAGTIGKELINSIFIQKASFDEQLMRAAEEINKSCPFMVDSDTQLDATIAVQGNTFIYKYTLINLLSDEIDSDQFVLLMKPNLINNVKTSIDLEIFRKNFVTMSYTYYDRKGVFIAKIDITSEDYK